MKEECNMKMKENYIAPEMEMITIQGVQLLAGSYDEALIVGDETISDPEDIH